MSLSTTSTATYDLTKYSRAYPSQASTNEADVEWQHYTNPVIRLVLDIKKTAAGELESYRVRVLWVLNAGLDAMDVDQRDVIFVSKIVRTARRSLNALRTSRRISICFPSPPHRPWNLKCITLLYTVCP